MILMLMVVICFQNCIFGRIHTANLRKYSPTFSCDLLSKLYLWSDSHSQVPQVVDHLPVVICFQNCIFGRIHTAILRHNAII